MSWNYRHHLMDDRVEYRSSRDSDSKLLNITITIFMIIYLHLSILFAIIQFIYEVIKTLVKSFLILLSAVLIGLFTYEFIIDKFDISKIYLRYPNQWFSEPRDWYSRNNNILRDYNERLLR
jgi:hypothetical protein